MSGGVDSTVAAFLLKERGYECLGATMHLYSNEDAGVCRGKTCCSLNDTEDARDAACRLKIPFYVFNFQECFRKEVIGRFTDSYFSGRTPNPCLDCNRYVKFNRFFERARILGCDHIATGHYARIEENGEGYVLKKALDPQKDQSYVLYTLTQEQLAHTIFPLGNLKKEQTRALAAEQGFLNARKPDSQDICFVPDGDYARIVELHSGKSAPPGDFISPSGKVLGRHKGIIHYTVGQHKGLGLSTSKKLYVGRILKESNRVVLCEEEELYRKEALVREMHWISGKAPEKPIFCKVKIRYRQEERPATVFAQENGFCRILFDEPQRAITPGQAAVLYSDDVVLGGGELWEAPEFEERTERI